MRHDLSKSTLDLLASLVQKYKRAKPCFTSTKVQILTHLRGMADNADDKSVASFKAESKSEAAKWTDHIRACTGNPSKASKPSTLASKASKPPSGPNTSEPAQVCVPICTFVPVKQV